MEEDILEERYKRAMEVINETSLPLFVEDTFEDIFLDYKQDEKIIKEMAKTWKQDDIRSVEEIIDYFRKRCK